MSTRERWAVGLRCSLSGKRSDLDRPAFLSDSGAPLLVEYQLDRERGKQLLSSLSGRPWTLWRYRELLPLHDFDERIDLGAGGTPMVRLRRLSPRGVTAWVKDESGNPTGSFKARGLSLAVNRARELGAPGVQIPSAGNAALALTAYAAAAGLPARVALPADTPPGIAERCRLHGAEVLSAPGTLVDAARQLGERDDGYWDLSTLKEPYRVEGKKTMGLELAEQLDWELPDWILYPTGGGTGLIGMHKAFRELAALGIIGPRLPRFVAVQMAGCAPMVRAFEEGSERARPWENPRTQVWGLRVPKAIGDFLILRALRESDGRAVSVAEEEIEPMMDRVARDEGLLVGPEGAAVMVAFQHLVQEGAIQAGERVVLFQTGHPANYR